MISSLRSRRFALLAGMLVWTVSSNVAQELSSDPGGVRSKGAESTIPAAFGIRTDRDGNAWMVEADGNIGRIGSTMVNSGLMLLVNEEKFTGVRPSMSPDGSEFVIHGMPLQSVPGLQLQRRVKLMEKSGGLRYSELFYNGSTDAVSITVGLATNFSGNYKTFLSDRGRSEPVIPNSFESAIIVLPGSSESSKAFLFTHSDTRSALRPTISAQNRYGLTFRFQISLEPGESGILVHHVAQVVIPQSFDRRTLLELSQPYSLDKIIPTLPSDWDGLVVNIAPSPDDSQSSALLQGGLDTLGYARGPRDVLVIGGETRLPGKVEEKSIRVSSIFGEIEIDLDRVAAIVSGKAVSQGEVRIFFNDGQILTAEIKPPGLTFTQTGGGRINLDPESFDSLVMSEKESSEDWKSDSIALVETVGGDRLKVGNVGEFSLGFSTPWGSLKIGRENLVWLRPAGAGIPGYRVELRDGTKCYGMIGGEEVALQETEFGDLRIHPGRLKRIFTHRNAEPLNVEGISQKVTVTIVSGDQEIVGSPTNTPVLVLTGGGIVETAFSEIRKAGRRDPSVNSRRLLPGESPAFEIERWDGGVIQGGLTLETVSVQSGDFTWLIPVRDIDKFETDSPLLSPEVAGQISGLVRQLGAEDWATRETATGELGAFGYLARPVLQRELDASSDPEVARRIERILDALH